MTEFAEFTNIMWQNIHFLIFFVLGVFGSGIYLFTLLIKGDRSMIDNMCKTANSTARVMVPLFIIIGGGITVLYQLFQNTPFVIPNAWEVFLVGFGWLGILASYTAGEKIAEAKEANTTGKNLAERVEFLEQKLRERG